MTTRKTEFFPSKGKLQENDAFIFVSFKKSCSNDGLSR